MKQSSFEVKTSVGMNVTFFIGMSAAVLLAWLGVTYVREIPHERYPKQGSLNSASAEARSKKLLVQVPEQADHR